MNRKCYSKLQIQASFSENTYVGSIPHSMNDTTFYQYCVTV